MFRRFSSGILLVVILLASTGGCISIKFVSQVNQEQNLVIEFETPQNPTVTEQSTVQPAAQEIDCMGASAGDQLTILHHWTGEEEKKFNQIIQPLLDKCGIKLNSSVILVNDSIQDQSELGQKIQTVSPDIVFWPWAGAIQEYKDQLYGLNQLGATPDNYTNFWRGLGTVNDHWIAVPVKIGLKSFIWYSPQQFQTYGYQVPANFGELNALVEKMVSDGNVPWSMGLESGGASGWLGSDFIQDLLLAQQGPDYVRNLISGAVPYDDAGVAQAYEIYGKWASDPKYALGGRTGTINTSFYDAISRVVGDHPEAMMVREADWVNTFILGQWPNYVYGKDYASFLFPGLRGLQGETDYMLAFHDTLASRALISYLTGSTGGQEWAKVEFGVSPNLAALDTYKDPYHSKLAEAISNATGFTPDLGDTIGGSFRQAEWAAIIKVIQGADIATELATVAAQQSVEGPASFSSVTPPPLEEQLTPSPSSQTPQFLESITIPSDTNAGITYTAPQSGTYIFQYSEPRSAFALGNGEWNTEVLAFQGRVPQWANSVTLNYDTALFKMGGHGYTTKQSAIDSTKGQTGIIELRAGEVITLVVADGKPWYGDNTGDIVLDLYALLPAGTVPATRSPASVCNRDGLAFVTNRDGNEEIYLMQSDGSDLVNLTQNPATDGHPSWSPTGDRIAFHSNRSGDYEIYTMKADGTDVQRLTNSPGWDGRPSWSPDGSKIAFESDMLGNGFEIFFMNTDGSEITKLANDQGGEFPDWSPDGSKLVLESLGQLSIIDRDGKHAFMLTYSNEGSSIPTWSPDGNKIYFSSNRNGNWDIYSIDADGKNLTRITNVSDDDVSPVSFLSEGSITFASNRFGNWDLFEMSLDRKNTTRLTNDAGDEKWPVWAPCQ